MTNDKNMNTISNPGKYLKYLVWFGAALCIMGLVAGLVSQVWLPVPVGLLVAGVIISVVGLGFLGDSSQSFWARRSTEAGTNALITTLAVVAILGLINFLAVRYGARVDLTENQRFTLSPQSQQVVENLQQPLKVWVFVPNSKPETRKLLENYRRNGSNFQFEFVDPQVQVGLAREFNIQSLGEVYLEYGDETQLVQTINQGRSLSEAQLTNAIQTIQRDRTEPVYFLQGHGEPPLKRVKGGLSQAVTSLKEAGYEPQPLNLANRSQIPEDAAAIVVAGPQQELLEGEVEALQNYLNADGSLLLMIEPDTSPGLEPLLNEWGMELDNRIIIDASGRGSAIGLGPATSLVTNYGNHPITKQLNGISIYSLARPITANQTNGIAATPLLISSQQSWAESNLESQQLEFNPSSDREGSLTLGFAVSQTNSDNSQSSNTEQKKTTDNQQASQKNQEKEQQKSRLVTIGDSTFATNGWFDQQLNEDVFLNTVNWLVSTDEQPLAIRPKEPTERRINLTSKQAGIISWMALLIIPLFGLIPAGLTWWRRR